MRISLRKEKAHCKLLKVYADSSDSELMEHLKVLNREQQVFTFEMGKNIVETGDIRAKHRMQLRRLYERQDMIDVCEEISFEGNDFDPGAPYRVKWEYYMRYADETLQKIAELRSDENNYVVAINASPALRFPLDDPPMP